MNALDWLDRAFALTRLAERRYLLRAWVAGAPLALVAVFSFYLERVEGLRDLRAVLALGLALAWWWRAHTLGGACRGVLGELEGTPVSAPRPAQTAGLAAVAGLVLATALLPAAGLAAVGGLGIFVGFALALPVGALAPSWVARAGVGPDGGFRAWRAAFRDGATLRGSALLLHGFLLAGALLLFVNLLAVVGMLLGGLQGLVGLEVSALSAFMSFDNDFALLATAAATLWLMEPLRGSIALVALLHARSRRDGADLRRMLQGLTDGADDRGAGRVGGVGAAGRVAALLFGVALASGAAHAQEAEPLPYEPQGSDDTGGLSAPDEYGNSTGPGRSDSTASDSTASDSAASDSADSDSADSDSADSDSADSDNAGNAGGPNGEAQDLDGYTPYAPPPLGEQDQATASEVEAILAGSEFREFTDAQRDPSDPDADTSWLKRLLDALERWLRENRGDEAPGQLPTSPMPVPPTWLFIGMAVALLLAVVAYLALTWRRDRGPGPGLDDALALTHDPRERAPEEHLDEAAELAARGLYRDAFRSLYLATLVALDRHREIDFDPARTNWHYLRQMGEGPRTESFRTFTRLFDQKWYGDEPTARDEYETGRRLATTLTAAPATPQGASSALVEVAP